MWLDSLSLLVVALFMALGLIGVFVPLLPGPLLIWLTAFVYGLAKGFGSIGLGAFYFITVIALATSTADIWMSWLGAKTGGASGRSVLYGTIGAIIGFILFNLIGAIIVYALGVIYGEYQEHRNWQMALKASVAGIAGWGLATVVKLIGAVLMIVIFFRQVLGNG